MKLSKISIIGLIAFSFNISLLSAQSANPPVIAGDLPDPTIIKTTDGYYAAGTSSEWAPHFPVYKSSDLFNWKQTGYIFDKAPEWTVGSFWAPEYYKIGNTYYLYYTARRKSDNLSFIGVATSKYPDHGFTDHGLIIEHGKEAIDAFVFNDNGQLYITFKAYGLDNRPIELLGYKLSADGLKTEGEPFTLLTDTNRAGMEGQSIMKKGNYYYIFYSAGNCCGKDCSYSVGVARSENFKGPYEYDSRNPLLSETNEWKCMGHGTFVTGKDGNTYYLHHAYNKKTTIYTGREALLAKLTWPASSGWPELQSIPTKTAAPQDFYDPFDGKKLSLAWQWDFRHSTPITKQEKGLLQLSGTQTADNQTGIALTVKPVSVNFDMTTEVVNRNNALKGLVIYGDANAAMGIGVEGDSVKVWTVQNNKRSVIGSAAIAVTAVELKITMNDGKNCNFFYKTAKTKWTELSSGISTNALSQWDRNSRPGLLYSGKENEEAQFSFFRIHNK